MTENIPTREDYRYGFYDEDIDSIYETGKGITADIIKDISNRKNEPEWMLNYRLEAFKYFEKTSMPTWGADLSEVDFDNYTFYRQATDEPARTWDDVPEKIKETFERLGVPEAERAYLAGTGAQYESEVVYHNMKKEFEKLGIIFMDTDSALQEYPEIFKEYFGTVVPYEDNKLAALNAAAWSGGTFIYVPKNVKVEVPIQMFFRINEEAMGQFERTLIVVDEGASVHYVEGCTAPTFSASSLHAATVEIIAKKDAYCRYTTIQNWSDNVYNLVTKRAVAHEGATVEWVDGNIGSKTTMKYPSIFLKGEGAKGNVTTMAMAGEGQIQDTGTKIYHLAPNTSSTIVSKSIARDGGAVNYRGQVYVDKEAPYSNSVIECDTIILDGISTSDTIPYNEVHNSHVNIEHEAKVSKVSEEQLYYLMSRGLTEIQAMEMIVMGFVEPISKELPMEYAVELNRLISFEMEGSIG